MNYLKEFLNSKALETWLWESGNALITIIAVYILGLELWWSVPVYGILNQISKWINVKYIKK